MVLLIGTLGNGLANLKPVMTEIEAINNLATAWENYFSNASVAGVPVIPGTLVSAISAMKAALVGLSVENMASIKIQAGIIAFWGVVAASASTIWVIAPPIISATIPPTLGTIAASLTSVFASNLSSKLGLVEAANAIAGVLHPIQLGGIAIQTPNIPIPIL